MFASKNKGFSLVEVLISVLILAVGVMGAAGLHLVSLQTARQSALHTSAMHLAVEMAESMRAHAVLSSGSDHFSLAAESSFSSNLECAIAADCADNSAEAPLHIEEWLRHVASRLPAGKARICRDAEPWNVGTQRLQWECLATDALAPLAVKIGWHDAIKEDGEHVDAPAIVLFVRLENS